MGVTYKLRDEVVQFIINQRQGNPLASCRQLAESASVQFGLHLSKSSVHDVLRESGIITPRGRKPKDRFEIPQEKKKQIQTNLSQIKLLAGPVEVKKEPVELPVMDDKSPSHQNDLEKSPEYDGAGKIFLKAALWDLGIFSEENVRAADWEYYLTYCKGVKVVLENNKDFFIDLPLPLERCIREVADGLVNNTRPFIVHKVSDTELFKTCMEAVAGARISKISIVGHNNHDLLYFDDIMEYRRNYYIRNRLFVDSIEINARQRAKLIFISQTLNNNEAMESIINLKGFDSVSRDRYLVTLLVESSYANKTLLQEAIERLNDMYLYDEKGRLVQGQIL